MSFLFLTANQNNQRRHRALNARANTHLNPLDCGPGTSEYALLAKATKVGTRATRVESIVVELYVTVTVTFPYHGFDPAQTICRCCEHLRAYDRNTYVYCCFVGTEYALPALAGRIHIFGPPERSDQLLDARTHTHTLSDLVQDIYLREIRAYKPPPVVRRFRLSIPHRPNSCKSCLQAKDAHVGVVKSFSSPSPPQAPSLPSDLASELANYDAAEPGAPAAPPPAPGAGESAGGAREYLAFLEQDLPKEAAHH